MKAKDIASETALSLTANKVRSALTILGIVVGIASVIVMVAMGEGTRASIMSSIQSMGSNLIMVVPGTPEGAMQTGAVDSLTLEDAEEVALLPGIRAAAPQMSSQCAVSAGGNGENVSVTGSNAAYAPIRNIETEGGAWYGDSHVQNAAKVAVIGPETSDTLFGSGSNPVGQRIRIKGVSFTVIGETKSKGASAMGNADDAVYVPISAMRRYLSGGDTVSMVFLEAVSPDAIPDVQDEITALLLRRHDIASEGDADFTVRTQQDLTSMASTVTSLLTVLLGSIAGISLVVGGIGIMNMMLTTVTERIREIGLRKAVGAKRADITSQFLAEAVALTMLGGLIGLALGWGISAAISAASSLQTQVTWGSVLLAVGVSTAIGIVFGYYPARRAAKLDAIEALRYQ